MASQTSATLAEGAWLAACPILGDGAYCRQGLPHITHNTGTTGISSRWRQGFTKSATFTGQYSFIALVIHSLFTINHDSHRQLNLSELEFYCRLGRQSSQFLFFSLFSPTQGSALEIFLSLDDNGIAC